MVTIRCAPWSYRDRVALFGDAAHAIVPSYGQGANSSFEDCLYFADCLDAHRGGWGAALADYERQRKPNADAIAELSLDHFAELRHHVGDPRFLLRKAVERALAEVAPERFLPLYSRVSFTCDSYLEALAAERRQRAVVDRILAVDGVAAAVEAGRAEALIAELLPQLEHGGQPGQSHRPASSPAAQ
jgi:kynurenine 3-monooxygenase